ncbi:MAG: zf-HC2 domain-containing protein [Actinomycetota bacterium]|nr:zf-HC2 domain-containing protein [Actinomycetota bacterium]
MTTAENDHIEISEKLAPYARGELETAAAASIRSHVDDCEACRAELDALGALTAAIDPPLSEIERARLHEGVRRRTQPSVRRPRRWGGIAAAIGAAALVALGVVLAGNPGSTSNSNGAGSALTAPREGGHGVKNQGNSDTAASAKAGGPPPSPLFERQTALTTSALRKRGAMSPIFKAFAGYYDSSNAARFQQPLVKQLAAQAPTSDVSSQIEQCAHSVLTGEDHPALPAYAAQTSIEDKPALVLGFAWTPSTTGPLDHYMFWAWPRSQCGAPLTYETGEVRP